MPKVEFLRTSGSKAVVWLVVGRWGPVVGRRSVVQLGHAKGSPQKVFLIFRILFQNEPKCAEMCVLQRNCIRKMRHAESLLFKDQWLEGRSVAGRRSSGPSRRSLGPGRRSSVGRPVGACQRQPPKCVSVCFVAFCSNMIRSVPK